MYQNMIHTGLDVDDTLDHGPTLDKNRKWVGGRVVQCTTIVYRVDQGFARFNGYWSQLESTCGLIQ